MKIRRLSAVRDVRSLAVAVHGEPADACQCAGRLFLNRARKQADMPILGIALLAIGTVFAAGCQSKASEQVASANTAPKEQPAKNADQPVIVELNEDQLQHIKIEPVRAQTLYRTLTATGKIQFNEDRTTRVLAPMAGQITDLQLHVGDPVQKDQLLFSIKSREVAALVTDYMQDQRDLDLAEKTHAMTKDLFDHQAASRISLQQAEGALSKAKAEVARSEEALRVVGLDPAEIERNGGLHALIPVKATAEGTVIERNVTPGQFVPADNTALLTIADLSSVWVLVDVFETDIRFIQVGEKVQVTAAAYPDRHFIASVDRIYDRVDPETRSLKVRLLVANPKLLLKPEMFITASLQLNDATSGVTVPAKAIITEDDKNYLFLDKGQRQFERRLVVANPDGEGRLRVTSGLKSGERLVTEGALLINYRLKQKQN
jgi:membrane fusion protein, heavy metal efflux system